MATIERIAKTPKAWEALARPNLVGPRAHGLLLMANGRRSARELSQLLGEDIEDLAQDLCERGYLQTTRFTAQAEDD